MFVKTQHSDQQVDQPSAGHHRTQLVSALELNHAKPSAGHRQNLLRHRGVGSVRTCGTNRRMPVTSVSVRDEECHLVFLQLRAVSRCQRKVKGSCEWQHRRSDLTSESIGTGQMIREWQQVGVRQPVHRFISVITPRPMLVRPPRLLGGRDQMGWTRAVRNGSQGVMVAEAFDHRDRQGGNPRALHWHGINAREKRTPQAHNRVLSPRPRAVCTVCRVGTTLGVDHTRHLSTRRIASPTGEGVLPTNALDYHLPGELIATQPPLQREDARLLVCHTTSGQRTHTTVRELPEFLRPNDLLIMNRSRVVPARLNGVRTDTAGKVQMLYLRGSGTTWEALVRARRLKPGMPVEIGAQDSQDPSPVGTVELLHRLSEHDDAAEAGAWSVRSSVPVETLLEKAGLPPLPPYILAARQLKGEDKDRQDDLERYQTVYAAEPGSVAAPTAGLHLTQPLLERVRSGGVRTAEVVLHVGTGTFKPVESEHLEQHPMHIERCTVSPEVIDAIHRCRASGGRVIAVGTTTARALESYAALGLDNDLSDGMSATPCPATLETNILITPGHTWRWVDGLLTNFHLPRSTLLAMVASLFAPDRSGVDLLLGVYEEAIAHRYRFYSYGDAMLVLP